MHLRPVARHRAREVDGIELPGPRARRLELQLVWRLCSGQGSSSRGVRAAAAAAADGVEYEPVERKKPAILPDPHPIDPHRRATASVPAAAVIRGRTTVGTRRGRNHDGDGDPLRRPSESRRARNRDAPMNFVWNLLIILVADAVAIAAMLLVRRRRPRAATSRTVTVPRASSACSRRGSRSSPASSIFLAFTSYDQSRSGAEREALTLDAAVRDRPVPSGERAPPPDRRARLLRPLGRAARSGRGMEDGSGGDTINPWAVALFQSMKQANAEDGGGAVRLRQVVRPDDGSRGGAARPHPRRDGDHPDLALGGADPARAAPSSRTCSSTPTAASASAPRR